MTLILSGTDGLSDVDGTAATPALRGTDANTGIFFPAADTIAFAEGGAEAMRIDSSGNVGIGTASPTVKLDVQGTAAAAYVGQSLTNGSSTGYVQQALNIGASGANGQAGTFYAPTIFYKIGVVGNDTTTPITFVNNNDTERARITSGGGFAVGKTTASENQASGNGFGFNPDTTAAYFSVVQTSTGTGNAAVYLNRKATSGIMIAFQYSDTQIGSISHSTTATTYNTSSDYRLKNTIAPMTGALAKVALLKPCTYKWNVDSSDGQGFIAHELQEVVPDCVTGEKDAVGEERYEVTPAVKDEEGRVITEAVMGTRIAPVYQGIDTSFLVATLTAAIQEQQALITALTTRITALEAA